MIVDKLQVKTIPGFPNYAISKDGRIWSKPRTTSHGHTLKGQWLRPSIASNGYFLVTLVPTTGGQISHLIHSLVLKTYTGLCPNGNICRHLDGNKLNNNISNLCWGTPQENCADTKKHGHSNYGERNGRAKLTILEVKEIRTLYRKEEYKQKEIAFIYGIHVNQVSNIVTRKSWNFF